LRDDPSDEGTEDQKHEEISGADMSTESNILVINCGSSSLKYKVFAVPSFSLVHKGGVEKIGEQGSPMRNHNDAIAQVFAELADKGIKKESFVGVGHRVVHGGERFKAPALIDDEVIAGITANIKLAPLHNPANLAGITACMQALPGVKQVAIFDTAFHATIPDFAYMYALPYEFYERERIRKYGFHGTSHSYVSRKAAEKLGKSIEQTKIITVHLGNGSSIAAVKGGKCVDTSMGFTPLAGLMMGTRCGDIDPALVVHIMNEYSFDQKKVDQIMNKQSGLLGVSGISNDVRPLKAAAAEGNARAALAIAMFLYDIKKYIGSYIYVLGGVDAIVFTAGIGENNPMFIDAITADLKGMFAKDPQVMVIPTEEELEIATLTNGVLTKALLDGAQG
jgi:acetate kinase